MSRNLAWAELGDFDKMYCRQDNAESNGASVDLSFDHCNSRRWTADSPIKSAGWTSVVGRFLPDYSARPQSVRGWLTIPQTR